MSKPVSNTLADALRGAAACALDRLDAQLLLLHALGRPPGDRAWLLAHDTDALPPATHHAFNELCTRRAAGEPLAYIVGHKEFFGLRLQVDARVLVPRPETETLVQWALEVLAAFPADARVADLGTGSGAIALALKQARPALQVDAVDASAAALTVAQGNAQQLGLAVAFRQASWLHGAAHGYHLVVSNPPYVAQNDPHLAALRHEPLAALAAGADGLTDLRAIAAQAPAHLAPGGWLLLEHGWDQAPAVAALLRQHGFLDVACRKDLAGIDRCTGARWSPQPAAAAASTARREAG